MIRTLLFALSAVFAGGQSPAPSRPPPAPLSFMDTTKLVPVGNYTLGYINNTMENDCHIGIVKFQASTAGQVSQFSFGAFSQVANETCGIGFVLKTFPGGVAVGTGVTALFTDVAMPVAGTIEMIPFPVPPTALWNLEANANYTITIQPFTWASGNTAGGATGGTSVSAAHCSFDVPYGFAGVPQNFLIGYHGPTGLPCGSTPLTVDKTGDGYSLLMKLKGAPLPSPSPSPTPSTTSTLTPTPTPTGTSTPTPTPTGTPSNTETPTQTLSPGSTASTSPTNSRTSSRTPSISYSPSPTPTETPSQTPTTTPTPTTTLSFRASPSVTPTETPGPTDSNSPTPKALAGIVTPVVVQAPQITSGHVVAAVCGGVALAIVFIGVAVRYRAVSFQINGPKKVKSWKPMPTTEINHNPLVGAARVSEKFPRKTKFEVVPV